MFKFEDLSSKIAEKSPSRAKAKGERLRKGTQFDDERARSEQSSESEGDLEKR